MVCGRSGSLSLTVIYQQQDRQLRPKFLELFVGAFVKLVILFVQDDSFGLGKGGNCNGHVLHTT